MVSQATWLLLIGLASSILTLEPSKTKQNGLPPESFIDQCTLVPTWTVRGERVISLVGQNVTVIALLNSSTPFGRQQASMLSLLRSRLYDAGFPAINFMVIDSMPTTVNAELLQHEAASIPVYQEEPEEPVREILGAGNDHILVLDRCGRMTYQVITPFSRLTNPYVKAAILSTYKDNPCGFCNISSSEMASSHESNTTLLYASDAPHQAEHKLDYCHDSATNLTVCPEPSNDDGNETVVIRTTLPPADIPNRENGLTHSFFPVENIFSEPQDDDHENTSQETATENVMYKKSSGHTAESVHVFIAEGQKRSSLQDAHMQGPPNSIVPQLGTQAYLGRMKNWDWSENQNNQSDIAGLGNTEQSVEVVHQKTSKKKKKQRKKKGKASRHNCASVQQCQVDLLSNLSSYEASNASMEKLVSQTQSIIDWYQQQTGNGTSNEDKYELTDVLKSKIIEHYKKLWPWLNYRLAPRAENHRGAQV